MRPGRTVPSKALCSCGSGKGASSTTDRVGWQQRANEPSAIRPPLWREIGYNVAQIRRYLAADDPVSHSAVEMRLLYSVAEVNLHYFTVRRLPWRGEKPAIQYWTDHDPEYLNCFHRFVADADRRRRVELYEELATHALAPAGGLWKEGETMISAGAGFGNGEPEPSRATIQDAQDFWQSLVEEPSN